MQTLAEAWKMHETVIRASGADDTDCHRARLSFYAGAAVALEAVRALGADDVDEEAAVSHLALLCVECEEVAGVLKRA